MARSSTQTALTAWDSDRHCISLTDMTIDTCIRLCACLLTLRVLFVFSLNFYPDLAVKVNVSRCHVVTFIKLETLILFCDCVEIVKSYSRHASHSSTCCFSGTFSKFKSVTVQSSLIVTRVYVGRKPEPVAIVTTELPGRNRVPTRQ